MNSSEERSGIALVKCRPAFGCAPQKTLAVPQRADVGRQHYRLLFRQRSFIQGQHVFHTDDVSPRSVPSRTSFCPRHGFRFWLASRMRIVSRPTFGTRFRSTASSTISRTLYRARPCGGGLQTMASGPLALACVQHLWLAGLGLFV